MATVNVYKPDMDDLDNSKKIVINAAKLEEYLAKGYIGEDAWKAICAQKAEEAYQAWLASPDSLEERFSLLRAARDGKIAATDYLIMADYPIAPESKIAVEQYRESLRDLPAQEGSPWDGGGELTPWPEMPVIAKA